MSQLDRDVRQDLRLMPCHAGGRSYYLDASAVRSVHRKEEWKLNWRSDSPLGWIVRDAAEIPILDLARSLGVAHTNVADNAVVVDTPAGPRAWGVSSVGRVVAVPPDQILPVPEPCRLAGAGQEVPWLGLVTGQQRDALCLAPQYLETGAVPPPVPAGASAASLGVPAAEARPTGRGILFAGYDAKGRLPEIRFCFGFGQIGEFITAPEVVPFPGGPPWLSGLLVWRDRTVPIVNLALGCTGRALPVDTEDFLVVRASRDGAFAAVTVFGRPDTVDLPLECDADPLPPISFRGWFHGAFRRKHQLILIPNLAGILAGD